MTTDQLYALLPLIVLSTVIMVLLIAVAFRRNTRFACGVAVAGLLCTLASVVMVYSPTPIAVTPLIVMDGYALLFSALILLTSLGVALLAFDYFRHRRGRQEEFFILLLLSTLGGMTLVASTHFASFILGLELLSISLYAMISYPVKGLFTLEAALKYLILSGLSSAFLLFGAALLYAALGTLSFDALLLDEVLNEVLNQVPDEGVQLPTADNQRYFLLAGVTMALAGVMFKLSLVPFHMWTPDVYEGAPAPVTAFVATISKGAIFALLLRFFILTEAYQYQVVILGLSLVAIASMLVGNILALLQNNVKRILAYSSIAHLGYLMVAFIAGGVTGGKALAMEASLYFLIAYFITTLGAFGIVTIMSVGTRSAAEDERDVDDLSNYEGLFWRRPALAATFTAMLLSLAGIPLTVGFIGKFYVFAAGIRSALWLLISTVIIGSGIGLFYYLRVIYTMTKRPSVSGLPVPIPIAGGWVMATLTLALLVFGVYPTPIIDLINEVIFPA